ncbi:MAG: SRPBCC family protein [Gemmatimonadales bacterium]
MKNPGSLTITTPSDREIAMARVFDAPRHLVWEAYTKPELLKRWLGVQGGWSLVVCEIDLRVGGSYRYLWRRGDTEMAMGGVYREVVPPERIVATELFDQPWYPGGAVGTVELTERDGQTTLTMTIRYDSRETRDAVLTSPMDKGVAESFEKLAELLPSMTRRA